MLVLSFSPELEQRPSSWPVPGQATAKFSETIATLHKDVFEQKGVLDELVGKVNWIASRIAQSYAQDQVQKCHDVLRRIDRLETLFVCTSP